MRFNPFLTPGASPAPTPTPTPKTATVGAGKVARGKGARRATSADEDRRQSSQEALERARREISTANYEHIIREFSARGIPMEDIKPRENVLTFNAWLALGRCVRKGEKSVRIQTWVPTGGTRRVIDDEATGAYHDEPRTIPRTAFVFHISQTDPLAEARARRAVEKASEERARTGEGPGSFRPPAAAIKRLDEVVVVSTAQGLVSNGRGAVLMTAQEQLKAKAAASAPLIAPKPAPIASPTVPAPTPAPAAAPTPTIRPPLPASLAGLVKPRRVTPPAPAPAPTPVPPPPAPPAAAAAPTAPPQRRSSLLAALQNA